MRRRKRARPLPPQATMVQSFSPPTAASSVTVAARISSPSHTSQSSAAPERTLRSTSAISPRRPRRIAAPIHGATCGQTPCTRAGSTQTSTGAPAAGGVDMQGLADDDQ